MFLKKLKKKKSIKLFWCLLIPHIDLHIHVGSFAFYAQSIGGSSAYSSMGSSAYSSRSGSSAYSCIGGSSAHSCTLRWLICMFMYFKVAHLHIHAL